MIKALGTKAIKAMIRALLRSLRKGAIKRDGKIDRDEVMAVAREFLDLIVDEVEPVTERRSEDQDIITDIRGKIGRLTRRR